MVTTKTTILEIFIISSSIILVFLFYFFNSLLRHQKKLGKLEEEKVTAEINAGNEERNKIATEIHNDLAPHITSVIYQVHQLSTDNEALKQQLLGSLSDCLEKMRLTIKEISPIEYYGITFQEAIENYIKRHDFEKNIEILIKYDFEFELLSSNRLEVFFRVLQEILLNTVKHAQATRLHIDISNQQGYLFLKTADDGIGYNSAKIIESSNKKGYGLLSILSRVKYLNGNFQHDLSKDPGTRYIISFPVEDRRNAKQKS
jgi:signal transduction histidine kinase